MTNEEFQNIILSELKEIKAEFGGMKEEVGGLKADVGGLKEEFKGLKADVGGLKEEFKGLKADVGGLKEEFKGLKADVGELKERVGSIEERQKSMEIRQDEIYQVVRAIEHSNQVGKSELDSQNIRLAKVEGKIKKAAKVLLEDIDVDKASNL